MCQSGGEEDVVDPPAVEDPIGALFDLADRAAGMAPVVRRLYRYTAAILVLWILIMLVLILAGLGSALWLSLLALAGLAGGVIALGLLRQTDRFFREFVQRHRWIHLVRDADPVPRIPEGRTPTERLARYLMATNPKVEAVLRQRPDALQTKVSVRVGGREVPLDLVIAEPGARLGRYLGDDDGSFAIIARVSDVSPTLEEVQRFEADAMALAPHLPGRLVRMIVLRTAPGPIPDAVYDYVVAHPIRVAWGWQRTPASVELITENPDGTYDVVPHVLGIP
jgi:hypothetical protein